MDVHADHVQNANATSIQLANQSTTMPTQIVTNKGADPGPTPKNSATGLAQSNDAPTLYNHGNKREPNDKDTGRQSARSSTGPQDRHSDNGSVVGANGHNSVPAQAAGSQTQSPVSIAPAPAPAPRPSTKASNMQPSVRVLGPLPGAPKAPWAPKVVDLSSESRKLEPNEISYNTTKVKALQPTDGRPSATPAGLHGKANPADGSFGMIQIDLAQMTRGERIAAAQRSSETTAAAAAVAKPQWNDPRHHQVWKTSGPPRTPATPSRPPSHQASRSSATPTTPAAPPQYDPNMYRPMAPADLAARGWPITIPPPNETKAEQARLLGLFRTIHPSSIVDQLCKGLSFFGGPPGQPPPVDGNFPPSDKHNGSGALFVRWLSEIFPPVETPQADYRPDVQQPGNISAPTSAQPPPSSQGPQSAVAPAPEAEQEKAKPKPRRRRIRYDENGNELPKRPRGRPPGSGNKHPRRDKGIKKGSRVEMRFYTDATPPTGDSETSVLPRPLLTPNGKRIGRPPGSKNKPKAPRDAAAQSGDGSPGSAAAIQQQSPSKGAPVAPMGQNGVQSFPSPQDVDSSDGFSSDGEVSDAEDSHMDATPGTAEEISRSSEAHAADVDRRSSEEQRGLGSQLSSVADAPPAGSRKRTLSGLVNGDGGSPDASQQLADEADLQSKRQRLSIPDDAKDSALDSTPKRPQAPMAADILPQQPQQPPPSPLSAQPDGQAHRRASLLNSQQQNQAGQIPEQYHRAAAGPQPSLNMDAQPLAPVGQQKQ